MLVILLEISPTVNILFIDIYARQYLIKIYHLITSQLIVVFLLVHPISALRSPFHPYPNNPAIKSNLEDVKREEKPKNNPEQDSDENKNNNMIKYRQKLDILSRLSNFRRMMTRFYGRVE